MDLILSAHDLDVERTSIAHGESLLDVVEHVALGQPALLPDPASSFCIEHQHVMLIQQATNIFRRWDNEFGGGLRRKAIIGQLNEASNMLGGPFRDEKVGRRFYSAVADLTQLAGWMSYDLEFHATAQRYFLLGMHLARDADDRPQVARMLYCLARQMIDFGRYAEALDLAQTGTYAIRRSATPKAMAMLLIIQARAYAGMGRASECSYALGIAQDAFSQAGPGTDPEWCAFSMRVNFMDCWASLCGISHWSAKEMRNVMLPMLGHGLNVARSRVPAHWAAFIQADFPWAG
jgi:hypothetical protein